MGPGFFYYRRRWNRRQALRAMALLAAAGVLAMGLYISAQMRPLLENLATARVSSAVTRIVSEAVYEAIENGEIQYDGLVTLEKDSQGKVTAVRSNMAAFNHLQSEILDTILTRVGQVSARELSIPIGTLTG